MQWTEVSPEKSKDACHKWISEEGGPHGSLLLQIHMVWADNDFLHESAYYGENTVEVR